MGSPDSTEIVLHFVARLIMLLSEGDGLRESYLQVVQSTDIWVFCRKRVDTSCKVAASLPIFRALLYTSLQTNDELIAGYKALKQTQGICLRAPHGRARVKIEKKLLLGGCIPAKCFMLRIAPQAVGEPSRFALF